MVTVEPDPDETTVIIVDKRRFTISQRGETESGVTIYITPKDQPKEKPVAVGVKED